MEANDIGSKFEKVLPTADGKCVSQLITVLVREGPAVQEVRLAEHDPRTPAYRDLGRDSLEGDRFPCDGPLCVFKFEIPAVLEAELVDHRRRERGYESGDGRIVLHKVVPEALLTTKDNTAGLDPRRRRPAHTVVFQREMVLGVNIPVDLREEQKLVTRSWNDTSQALEKPQRLICLCLRNPAAEQGLPLGQRCRWKRCAGRRSSDGDRRKEGGRAARIRHPRKVTFLLVRVEEEEQLILNDWPPNVPSKLMALVLRLHGDRS